MSSKRNPDANMNWETPEVVRDAISLFLELTGRENIGLDPATTKGNPMDADKIRTPACDPDGLATIWAEHPGLIFVNPPYEARWFKKVSDEIDLIKASAFGADDLLALLPGKPCTRYFQRLSCKATAVCFFEGRLVFNDPETGKPRVNEKTGKEAPAGFDSALLYFGPHQHAFCLVFEKLGWCLCL